MVHNVRIVSESELESYRSMDELMCQNALVNSEPFKIVCEGLGG